MVRCNSKCLVLIEQIFFVKCAATIFIVSLKSFYNILSYVFRLKEADLTISLKH